ncbi:hypothetical protein RyT2_10640 [Pseudolactococcus yaeyamensis]
MRNISIIKWGSNRYNDSYWYGSVLSIDDVRAHFSSPLMPIGGSIKTWHSFNAYSRSRASPMLPLLVRNNSYSVSLFLEENDANHFQVTVAFYDKFKHEIGTEYFDDLRFSFTYPPDAVNYEINLINKKHDSLIFYFMLITEVSRDEESRYEMSRNQAFSVLKSKQKRSSQTEDALEIAIHYLVRETSILSLSDAYPDTLQFFVTKEEKSFLEVSVALIQMIKKTDGGISLVQGINFAQLPNFYHLLPSILRTLLPDNQLTTTLVRDDEVQSEREVRKYVSVISQMLNRETTKI